MIISFDKDFLKYTKFKEEVQVEGATIRIVLEKLFNEYPQLYVFLVKNDGEEAAKTSFKLNDIYMSEVYEIHQEVNDSDTLYIGRDIPFGENAAGKMIAGVLLIAASYIPGAQAASPWLVGMGLSLILGGVADLVVGTPLLPTFDSGSSTSATYTFSGIKNTTVLGTPVGVVYGTHRVGGHILNVYNDVIGEESIGNSSWLRMQLGLCEGEINNIDPNSIEINGRSSLAFPKSDLGVLVRFGTKDQIAPDAPLVTPTDATSTVVPNNRVVLYPTTTNYSLEYTLETLATSVEVFMSSFWGLNRGSFKIYWKEATSSGDYEHMLGPYSLPDAEGKAARLIPSTPFLVNFPTTAMYKIKVVLFNVYTNGVSPNVAAPQVDGQPFVLPFPQQVHNLYVDKYVIHNSGVLNTDVSSVMEFFNKIENSTSYSLLINNDPDGIVDANSPGSVVSTSGIVDSLKINLAAPALYKSSAGALIETAVDIKLYWKLQAAPSYLETDSVVATIRGKTKSEVEYSMTLPVAAAGIYDVKAVRVTPSNELNLLITDRVYLKDVVEILQEQLIYPHTAMLGLSIKATDYISGGLPNITSIIQGTKVLVPENYNGTRRYMVGDFTGSFNPQKQWTDNPIWCLYDLITNARYGLKNYFKISPDKLGLMQANFFIMSQYCDTRLTEAGVVITDPSDANYESARPRFSLNIVIDQSKSAMEWLSLICATMRATLYYTEGMVFIDIDRAKPITQVFNMSNIKDFTEAGSSFKQLPNVYEVQFNNKLKDYDQETILLEDPEYQKNLDREEVKKTLQLIGVTEEAQAKSLAKYALKAGQLLTTTITFKTSTYGLLSTVGDVVGVQHDVPQWGYGGTVKGLNIATKGITLSDEVEIKAGITYSIQVGDKGTLPQTLGIVTPAPGIYTSLTLAANPVVPFSAGAYYVVGEATNVVKPFKIVSLTRDKDEVVDVTCVAYNSSIYGDADNLVDTPSILNFDYSQLPFSRRLSVKTVVAEATTYVDTAGNVKTGATVYYTKPSYSLNWAGVIVYYGVGGTYNQCPLDRTGTVSIQEIPQEGDYRFICISTYTDGTRQTVSEALADSVDHPYFDVHISPVLGNDAFTTIGITNLSTTGAAGEYLGKVCTVTWDTPILSNYTEVLGSSAANRSLLDYYKVDIKNTNGTTRRTTRVYEEIYVYTHELNREDGTPVRTFDVVVTAVDKLGRVSAAATLRCSNPVPLAIT